MNIVVSMSGSSGNIDRMSTNSPSTGSSRRISAPGAVGFGLRSVAAGSVPAHPVVVAGSDRVTAGPREPSADAEGVRRDTGNGVRDALVG